MIPKVKVWKVTVEGSTELQTVYAPTKLLAKMNAIHELGLWGKTFKVSLYKGPFAKDFRSYGFSQPVGIDPNAD